VSDFGAHDFPEGAQVNLLAIDGDDYLVELEGVSVKNNKSFFGEIPVGEEVPAVPTPAEATPTPEPTPFEPLPTPTPTTDLSEEERKINDLSDKIRLIDEEVRAAKEQESSSGETGSTREIQKLQTEKEKLSEELSTISKP